MKYQVKPIYNFSGYYADKDGNIWSSQIWGGGGYGKPIQSLRELKPCKDKDGYSLVSLYKHKKQYTRKVHRLILETFVGPCPKNLIACHNNDIKNDNKLFNLRWDTQSNNQKERNNDSFPKGEQKYGVKLNSSQVKVIRAMKNLVNKPSQLETAKIFNVSQTLIGLVQNYKIWTHI